MKKNWQEIGISSGLVFLMIGSIMAVDLSFPAGIRPMGFALIVPLFMVAMGLVGLKLIDT
ncbi:MAG TPA: hypothetical protein PKK11_04630 [Methanothrix sp.]|nr:hypothetical protein [Methanothrix sp.]HPT19233.1 hypothetical protein [Methanothrix sp.]